MGVFERWIHSIFHHCAVMDIGLTIPVDLLRVISEVGHDLDSSNPIALLTARYEGVLRVVSIQEDGIITEAHASLKDRVVNGGIFVEHLKIALDSVDGERIEAGNYRSALVLIHPLQPKPVVLQDPVEVASKS